MYVVKRSNHNPILIPNRDHYWEEFAAFNMCPIKRGKTIYGLYRAISAIDPISMQKQISTVGIAESKDGIHFENHRKFIAPEEEWEMYGCEDPRVTYFEGKYYIFYTALSRYPFGPEGIKVAVAISKDLKTIDERHLVTPFNAKAMTLFPKKVGGKIAVVFSAHTDSPPAKMSIALFDRIEDLWDESLWEKWIKDLDSHAFLPKRAEFDHLEIGAPPVETKDGWLLIYSHIKNYFPGGGERIFGIEAALLDRDDPTKILGRTLGPLIVPEEPYERSGYVPEIVFPSGALIKKDTLSIYYGAADTTACVAFVSVTDLVGTINEKTKDDWGFKRYAENPIIVPNKNHPWESKATFNPAALYLGGKFHILYRTLSDDNTSSIGYAASVDGLALSERLADPVYVPRADFELKKINGGNSGCEDPRLTQIGKVIYISYTAYDSIGPPRVAISSISEKDFLARNWKWEMPLLVTPGGLDDKDTCLLPGKLKNGYFILHRASNEICGDYLKSLNFTTDTVNKCIRVLAPRIHMWDSEKVGIAAPPIKTKYGWLLLYHGVAHENGAYRVGVVLLDIKDPSIILARATDAIFEPIEKYEKEGIVNNVVFPCGMIAKKGTLYIYYGGADSVVGVATMKLSIILEALVRGAKL